MKKTIATCFFLLLFLVIFHAGHIIGGVNGAYAQEYRAFQEKNIYEVTVENNSSKIVSKMFVYAYTLEQAREQVALNGWKVLDVKLSNEKTVKEYEFSADTVNSITPRNVQVDSDLTHSPLPSAGDSGGQSISTTGTGARGQAANVTGTGRPVVGRGAQGEFIVADNLELLPDSASLEILRTVFFSSGEIEPIRDSEGIAQLKSLLPARKYIIFGHADDVRVVANNEYASNFELSFKRAETIKNIMIANGIPAENIDVVGLGTRYPAVKNGPDNNALNRRAEVYGFRSQN